MIICIEGVDGVGKTTAINLLTQALKKKYNVKVFREPGGSFLGEISRYILEKETNLKQASKLFLFLFSRSLLIEEIRKLNYNTIIILDRFSPSTIAYQGLILGQEEVLKAEQLASENIIPDFTFYLFNDPEICVEREYAREKIKLNEIIRKIRVRKIEELLTSYEKAFELLNWPNVKKIKTDQTSVQVAKEIYSIFSARDLKQYER